MSSPGVVVCISTIAGGEQEENEAHNDINSNGTEPVDFDFAQATIRELWGQIRAGRDLGRGEVKEVFMAPSDAGLPADAKSEETDAIVRMWCEVLRLRG